MSVNAIIIERKYEIIERENEIIERKNEIIERENEIIERENEIKAIERDVEDVNQIFKELQSIIHEQARCLHSIEEHIENTVITTEKAAEELHDAYRYSRFGSCITLGLAGAAIGGPVGFLAGIKSGVALAGLSLGGGVIGYKAGSWLY